MRKIYAIKLDNGNLHKNNLGEIVYFSNKNDVRAYMKYNHYDGTIQPINIDIEKDRKISDLEAKLAESKERLELADCIIKQYADKDKNYAQQLAESEERYKKAYREGLLQKQFDKDMEIDQLKQQLAEKDLRIEELESQFAYECECNKQFVDCQKENENLKQQLAEKEKEIEDIKKSRTYIMNFGDKVKEVTIQDQDKISFCIEKLEEIDKFVKSGYCFDLGDVRNEIDNQIKQLKKEMK